MTSSDAKLSRLGVMQMLPREEICVSGRYFSFYVMFNPRYAVLSQGVYQFCRNKLGYMLCRQEKCYNSATSQLILTNKVSF